MPRRRAPLLAVPRLPEAPPLRRRRSLIGLFEMRRAGAHLGLQRRRRALFRLSPGPRGRSLHGLVPASPAPVGARRPARASGQHGDCGHEVGVSTRRGLLGGLGGGCRPPHAETGGCLGAESVRVGRSSVLCAELWWLLIPVCPRPHSPLSPRRLTPNSGLSATTSSACHPLG